MNIVPFRRTLDVRLSRTFEKNGRRVRDDLTPDFDTTQELAGVTANVLYENSYSKRKESTGSRSQNAGPLIRGSKGSKSQNAGPFIRGRG